MDSALLVAFIAAFATLGGVVITVASNYFKERRETRIEATKWDYAKKVENQKWEHEQQVTQQISDRNYALEDLRAHHEKTRWLLDLYAQREVILHQKRLETYPAVFEVLEALSRHKISSLNQEDFQALADKLNVYGYAQVGLYMKPETRLTLFKLRDMLFKFADGSLTDTELLTARIHNGPRTLLIECMQADISQEESLWLTDLDTLIEIDLKQGEQIQGRGNTPLIP